MVTTINHGDLMIEFDANRTVSVTRQSNATRIAMSLSEWQFVLKCAELRDWPIHAPIAPASSEQLSQYIAAT